MNRMDPAGNDYRLRERSTVSRFPTEKSKLRRRERKERFNEMLEKYRNTPDVESMEQFIQHGETSTLGHSENVAWVSFLISEKLHLHTDEQTLVDAAVLHDFYLYDWHDRMPERKKHRYEHPEIACENAMEQFEISEKAQDAIRSHMWPVNIKRIPRSKEAAILCLADKYCASVETIRLSKHLGLK